MTGYGRGNRLNLKDSLGIWLGKFLISATRLAGRGGTTLPGRVSLQLAPRLLPALSQQIGRNIVITGTNGKSTTTALLTHILQTAGYTTLSNSTGSNLSWGIATTMINASTWGGKMPYRYGVLEVDEGVLPKLTGQLKPVAAVVTNIFPDQPDRFGGVDYVRQSIARSLVSLPAALLILNADDPLLASLETQKGPLWYYGLENLPSGEDQPAVNGAFPKNFVCPRCRQLLHYEKVFVAHQGHYRCLHCGFKRPQPSVTLLDYIPTREETALLKLGLKNRQEEVYCPLPGIYNIYNVLASITAALALGLPISAIKQALSGFPRVGGRFKQITLGDGGKSLVIILTKNAVGTDQALQLLYRREVNPSFSTGGPEQKPGPGGPAPKAQEAGNDRYNKFSLLIAINDHTADGIDVSWLWNTGFEQLATLREQLGRVIVSGTRAWDVAVRLKYAGLDPGRITVKKNLAAALDDVLRATLPGRNIYILANYTALAVLNRALDRRGIKSFGSKHDVGN